MKVSKISGRIIPARTISFLMKMNTKKEADLKLISLFFIC
jgi:hypothetical protein